MWQTAWQNFVGIQIGCNLSINYCFCKMKETIALREERLASCLSDLSDPCFEANIPLIIPIQFPNLGSSNEF